jgi:hypothetical protein
MFGRSGAITATALSLIGPLIGPLIGSVSTVSAADAVTAHAVLTAPPSPPGPRPPADKAAPKGPTELTDLRGPATTSFRFPNGARSVLMSTGRLRTTKDTAWQPINLTLRQDPDGTVRPIGPAYATELSGGGRVTDAASVQGPTGITTTLTWNGTLPTPTIAQNRAVYRQARPGSDLVVEVTRTGFVASLVPTSQSSPTSPAGQLASAIPAGNALQLRITQPDGSGAASAAESLVSQLAPAGRLGDGPVADRVVATAVRQSKPPFSTTVQNTPPTEGSPADLSADPDLRVGSFDGHTVSRGYLTWDLSGLRGQPVTKAMLRLFAEWSPTCDPRTWQVWSTGPIDPAAGWAEQPTPERLWTTASATKGHGAGCPAGWVSVDVTPLVQEWARTGVSTGTIMIRAADEANPQSWKRFTSGEGLKPPTLGITVAAPAP